MLDYKRKVPETDRYSHELKVSLISGATIGVISAAVISVIVAPRVSEISMATSELIGAVLSIVLLFSALAFTATFAVMKEKKEIELSNARAGIDERASFSSCVASLFSARGRRV